MLEAFLVSVITMATPILLAALGELLVEESGVINIGIEGAMLSGAFAALTIAYFSGSTSLGLAGAIVAGVAINAIFAVLVVNLAVNQVVTGTAVSILALGLTGVFYRKLFGVTGKAFMVAPIAKIPLGPLARIPLLGPVLFDHNPLVYFTFMLVPALWYLIARTRYGLAAARLRRASRSGRRARTRRNRDTMAGAARVGRAHWPGRRVPHARVRQHLRREHLGRPRLRRAVGGDCRPLEFMGPRRRFDSLRRRDGVAIRIAGARHRRALPVVPRAAIRADTPRARGFGRTSSGAERAGRAVSPAIMNRSLKLRRCFNST